MSLLWSSDGGRCKPLTCDDASRSPRAPPAGTPPMAGLTSQLATSSTSTDLGQRQVTSHEDQHHQYLATPQPSCRPRPWGRGPARPAPAAPPSCTGSSTPAGQHRRVEDARTTWCQDASTHASSHGVLSSHLGPTPLPATRALPAPAGTATVQVPHQHEHEHDLDQALPHWSRNRAHA